MAHGVQMQPVSVIKARLGINPNGRVQAFFTNTCYKAMDKYVPMDKGNLRSTVDLQTNSITYEMPYARYQYFGVRDDGTHVVQNYTTAGTGTYWDKRMWSAEKDDIINRVQKYVDRGGR